MDGRKPLPFRGQVSWECHRYCHKRHVALPSRFRDETSTVEYIDPPELVVASAEVATVAGCNKVRGLRVVVTALIRAAAALTDRRRILGGMVR